MELRPNQPPDPRPPPTPTIIFLRMSPYQKSCWVSCAQICWLGIVRANMLVGVRADPGCGRGGYFHFALACRSGSLGFFWFREGSVGSLGFFWFTVQFCLPDFLRSFSSHPPCAPWPFMLAADHVKVKVMFGAAHRRWRRRGRDRGEGSSDFMLGSPSRRLNYFQIIRI